MSGTSCPTSTLPQPALGDGNASEELLNIRPASMISAMDPSSESTETVPCPATGTDDSSENHKNYHASEDEVDSKLSTATATTTDSRQEAAETASFLIGDDHAQGKDNNHISGAAVIPDTAGEYTWLPLALRIPFLGVLSILSLVLGIVTLVLTVYSVNNHGLGDANDSSALFFGWRFSPTLVATIYALLVVSMLHDVRRTEVFARLSRTGGAPAAATLCLPSRSWWNDPFDALSKTQNNSTRSWTLLLASIVYILILLVVSPLSAGFLSPIDIHVPRPSTFDIANLPHNFSWDLDSLDAVVFRTTSGSVLNKTTSAWLSDDYAIMPFWPLESPDPPLGSSFTAALLPQEWMVRTVAYRTELDCIPMSAIMYNKTIEQPYEAVNGSMVPHTAHIRVLNLTSQDGCHITISDEVLDATNWMIVGGGWWSNPPDYGTPKIDNRPYGNEATSNSTGNCANRTMFFYNTADRAQAHLCRKMFSSAEVSASVLINSVSTSVTIDPEEYTKNQQPLDLVRYNMSAWEDAFLNFDWSAKFPQFQRLPTYIGPLLSIAAGAEYNNDADKLVNSENLLRQASRLYQQFFGEMLLLALQSNMRESTSETSGHLATTQRRVSVILGIGITIGVIFLLSACCIAFVAYSANVTRRALNLYQDPGTIAAAASLIAVDQKSRDCFQGTDLLPQKALEARLKNHVFSNSFGHLHLVGEDSHTGDSDTTPSTASVQRTKDTRPALLRGWMGPLLLSYLFALLAALIVLFEVSRTIGVHQSPFVYQRDFSILGTTTTLAPYSIIPTLFAVGVKLWFGAIGDTLKRLQPYISMAKVPALLSDTILAEYVNTPIALISVKAVKHSHWILALVGIGAFATEAFTVSIAALWNRETRDSDYPINISRQLGIRNIPQVIEIPFTSAFLSRNYMLASALTDLYESTLQSWLYGATVELSQSAATPPWSKDTWSFLPLDMNDLQTAASLSDGNAGGVPGQMRNITFQTPALRARLECHALDYLSDTFLWLTRVEFSNRTIDPDTNQTAWNATNSPPGLDHGFTLKGYANKGALEGYLTCCGNETNGIAGDAAIGYWSNIVVDTSDYVPLYQKSMNAKWIVGRPLNDLYRAYPSNRPFWIWTEEPRIAAINCTPIIEQAGSSVVVELGSGVIYEYDILGTPQEVPEAWSDEYLTRNTSIDYVIPDDGFTGTNLTASWGYVFWNALLNSGRAEEVGLATLDQEDTAEDTEERLFNFRSRGLNADFMSYAMLALANNSKEALLNTETFMDLANKTVGVFFKHFASENVTSALGGYAYQPIGEKLPWSLGAVVDGPALDQQPFKTRRDTVPDAISTPGSVQGNLHVPVEQLVISPVAMFLCIALLAILVLTTIVIYSVNRTRYKALPRDVDTLASTLAFVHGSEKLLRWVQESPQTSRPWYRFSSPKRDERTEVSQLMARMGPFEGSDGTQRWGIELFEPETTEERERKNESSSIEPKSMQERSQEGDGDVGLRVALLGNFDWEMNRSETAEGQSEQTLVG